MSCSTVLFSTIITIIGAMKQFSQIAHDPHSGEKRHSFLMAGKGFLL